ncbi:MAG: RHS repeat-associated core domain-containing protein, partial [Anaerolineae bacterium]|nr:RHS repeat-associated core domain-containing protein [Anaerolineae bacterium]
VVETATTYEPYGEVLQQTGTSETVYGFTGEQEDSATGLLYLRARYYSPYLNHFHSRDPFSGFVKRPVSQNGYNYANGNPVRWRDPSGHVVECSATGGGCGGGYWQPPDEPQVVEISPGLEIIIMPPHSDPPPINENLAKSLGYVNAGVDLAEAGTSIVGLLGCAPARGLQVVLSGVDIGLAGMASYYDGETGLVTLHPSLPEIYMLGQDPIFTAAEAGLVVVAQNILLAAGTATGTVPGVVGGYVAGQGVDIATSLGSAVHDVARAEGVIPTWFAIGMYWDSTAPTRIPLVGWNQPVAVIVIYQQD